MLEMLANHAAPPVFTRVSPTAPALCTASLAGPLLPPRTVVFLEGLTRSQSLIMLLGRKTAPERVASALIDLARQFGRPAREKRRGAVTFHIYPTRCDLADWLGLAIETVSWCLTRLKKAGLIDVRHGDLVTVLDPQQLSGVAAPLWKPGALGMLRTALLFPLSGAVLVAALLLDLLVFRHITPLKKALS